MTTNLPAYFPRTAKELVEWRRNTKARTLNDELDQLHQELIIVDDYYALLVAAGQDEDAVTGKIKVDDVIAAQRAHEHAKQDDNRGRYPLTAQALLADILHSHIVAKRRAGMSRDDMLARSKRAGGPPPTSEAAE